MSAVSRTRKVDPLSKKIPDNPRYKNVKPTIDTGASISCYMRKIEWKNKYITKRPDEIFKRMKISTFVQLIIQIHEYNIEEELSYEDEALSPVPTPHTERPETADLETDRSEKNGSSPVPSIALTDGDFGAMKGDPDTARSTLQSVIGGMGEIDMRSPQQHECHGDNRTAVEPECPYLLLDCRDADAYNECHIITALNYPKAMISRNTNSFTKEIFTYKNQPGKVIIVYDEDEKLAHLVVSTMVDRGVENVFLLSGGLKMAVDLFKEGFITGTIPHNLSGKRVKERLPASCALQKTFISEDIEKLRDTLDIAVSDRSTGSRLSRASTSSSRTGTISQMSARSTASSVTGRPPFK